MTANQPGTGRLSRRRACAGVAVGLLAACRTDAPPVRLVSVSFQETFPLHAAIELGYFRDAGITIQVDETPRGSQVTESLVAGSADIAYNSFYDTLQRLSGARRLRSFCAMTLMPPTALVAAAKSNLRSVDQLIGSVVGVAGFGSAHHRMLHAILTARGIDSSAVQLVATGNGSPAIAALEHGKVQASVVNTSVLNALKRRMEIRVLADPRSKEGCRGLFGVDSIPSHAMIATAGWLERNPLLARRIAEVLVKTMRWIREHPPEDTRARFPERLRTGDAEADVETIRSVTESFSGDGRMPGDGPATVRRLFTLPAEKQFDDAADLAGTFTNAFVEDAR